MLVLSHPTGNANSRQALLTFYELNILTSFYTTFAWKPESLWNQILPLKVRRELERRTFPQIPQKLVHTMPARELCRVLAGRLGMRAMTEHPASPFSIPSIYRKVDSVVADAIARRPPLAVYAYASGALQTFRVARRMGIKTIYELPIAYWHFMNEFLREEAALQPEFADTIQKYSGDPDWTRRQDEELELTDQLIVPSGYVKSTLPESMADVNVRVIPYGAPCGVSSRASSRSQSKGRLRVLYVGALTQRKGISYLLDAIRKVEAKVELTIIGPRVGACRPVDAAIHQYRWMGSLPHSMVLNEMREHDVLAFPTLSEGFALVILEAMSRGMVVITTANSGALEVITDGRDGYIVPIRSGEAIAERLEGLADDRALLGMISRASAERAEEFTWQNYRQQLASTIMPFVEHVSESRRV